MSDVKAFRKPGQKWDLHAELMEIANNKKIVRIVGSYQTEDGGHYPFWLNCDAAEVALALNVLQTEFMVMAMPQFREDHEE